MTASRRELLNRARHVQLLVRAFSILEVLARSPAGITLRDLSRLAGLHKSTALTTGSAIGCQESP
jgi:hypothetical protein